MATDYGRLSPRRRRVLGVVMLGVLGLGVLVAWSLQAPAGRRTRAAVALLEEARSASADALWPEKLRIDWYLEHDGAGVTGWKAVVRGRDADGRFLGAEVTFSRLGPFLSTGRWQLTPGLTEGHYRSEWRRPDALGKMDIDLRNGRLMVRGETPGRRVDVRDEAPANYLPEGTRDLMAHRVARAGADAQFLLIFDDRQHGHRMAHFDTVRMRSLGRQINEAGKQVQRVRVTGLRTVRVLDQVLEIDTDGTIVRRLAEGSGVQWELTGMEEVLKHYRDAPVHLLRELRGDLAVQVRKLLLGRLKRLLPETAGPKEKVSI